ncbi:MAG: hypothetical protein SchgKO_09220 [Schleiferiaceae bacterium]|jgi:hypothetical protein
MVKMMRIVEIMWLVVATVCLYEVIMGINGPYTDRYFIFVGGVFLGVFMYFFRRNSRRRIESRRNNQ